MTASFTVELQPGAKILTNDGVVEVAQIQPRGVLLRTAGGLTFTPFDKVNARAFEGDGVQAVAQAMTPWWSGLSSQARETALFKLGVVLEILTGYRSGWAVEASPHEPAYPFGEGYGVSIAQRCEWMAAQLKPAPESVGPSGTSMTRETYSKRTVQGWVAAFQQDGLRGLVDGRSNRDRRGFDDLDRRFVEVVETVLLPFDGTSSAVSIAEIRRRVLLRMKQEGVPRDLVPERLSEEYVSWRYRQCGLRPRAHRSTQVRKRQARQAAPLLHPAHTAIDSTRADNLVHDELRQKAYSVEITVILSVATRVCLALRVTPRSANGVEAALVFYDALRPFSQLVEGTQIDDWRWAGVPRSLTSPLFVPRTPVSGNAATLQGLHRVPGLRPSSIRSDHGSIFMSAHFKSVLRHFGTSLWPSRVGASTDNSFVERFWEMIQSALQQIPGYKGRNSSERGRVIVADKPLMTAHELESYLRRYVALVYHRRPHDGIMVPGLERERFSPLEAYDILSEVTGDLTIPQHPDLIYDVLPIRWLTIRHDGVEYRGLTYDSNELDDFRHVRPGTFRPQDAAAPFAYDPRDVTTLHFRAPDGRVRHIPSRHSHLLLGPLTQKMRDAAIRRAADRGTERWNKKEIDDQIIDELGELYTAPAMADWQAAMSAERLRWETAQRDHGEVLEMWRRLHARGGRQTPSTSTDRWDEETWPDLGGAPWTP